MPNVFIGESAVSTSSGVVNGRLSFPCSSRHFRRKPGREAACIATSVSALPSYLRKVHRPLPAPLAEVGEVPIRGWLTQLPPVVQEAATHDFPGNLKPSAHRI